MMSVFPCATISWTELVLWLLLFDGPFNPLQFLLGHTFDISSAYFWNILHIFGVSFRHIMAISCAYHRLLSRLLSTLLLDHNDGQFFRAMEWLMVFFRPPLPSMVFQWFWQSWTITIECFLGCPTIGTNGFSMVFEILRAMVNNGFEVNDD